MLNARIALVSSLQGLCILGTVDTESEGLSVLHIAALAALTSLTRLQIDVEEGAAPPRPFHALPHLQFVAVLGMSGNPLALLPSAMQVTHLEWHPPHATQSVPQSAEQRRRPRKRSRQRLPLLRQQPLRAHSWPLWPPLPFWCGCRDVEMTALVQAA